MTRIHWFSLLCCVSLALACSSPSGQASITQAKSSAKQYPNFGAYWYAGQAEITFRPGERDEPERKTFKMSVSHSTLFTVSNPASLTTFR